ILMCIGASPAGTGGGIKTTTVALVFLGITSVLNGRADVTLWRRRINWNIVRRAFAVFMIFVCIILAVTFLISCIEVNRPAGLLGMENQLYEVSSALGTVGLSVGVTSMLSDFSRVLIMLCMFAGRIGPLTMMLALAGRSGSHGGIRYPEETLLVG
ncbi:MAG: potassium transporter TrkG, partial [Eubacteriales bacterium]|nr:potassium transporter TrkG [Eubacteriales bacterium]